jgi:hypothetical protein
VGVAVAVRVAVAVSVGVAVATTHGRSASDGFWLMVGPLPSGHHRIHFEAKITSGPGTGYGQKVTYQIVVS